MLDSNLFTHRNTYAILRDATSETYGPRVYSPLYKFPIYFILQSLLSVYIIKIPKIFILSYYLHQISLLQVAVKGLTTSLLRWLRVLVCLCRCVGLLRSLLLDWYLGSQKLREILTLLCCITLSSSRENQCSAQEEARMISGAVAREVFAQVKTYQVAITNASPSHLHYFPFASRFPLPHFTLAVLFTLSFPISSLSFACLFPFARVLDRFALSLWLVPYPLLCLPSLKFFTSNKDKEKT